MKNLYRSCKRLTRVCRSYWTQVLLKLLKEHKSLSVQEMSDLTMIKTDDIISTLQVPTAWTVLQQNGPCHLGLWYKYAPVAS